MRDIRNYSLLEHNTFGIDAMCGRFLEYASVDEAVEVAGMISSSPFLIVGGGSNLLLTGDYPGTVVTPAPMADVSAGVCLDSKNLTLRCWAGLVFDDVVDYCVDNGLYGLENLSLIPGQVGASAVQNIGAYGAEVKDVICSVEAVEIATGKVVTIPAEECRYAYRQSRFKTEWRNRFLITFVTYRLSTSFTPHVDYGNIRAELDARGIATPTARQLRDVIIDIRNAKLPDPKVEGNAGSFFMNPIVSMEQFENIRRDYPSMPFYEVRNGQGDCTAYKIPAGWMIDQCGWKGKTIGPAGVHSRQALVLVNKGGATGSDIVRLMKAVQHDVCERFGISLQPEVNIV